MAESKRVRVPLPPEVDRDLAQVATQAKTTKAEVAKQLIISGLQGSTITPLLEQILERQQEANTALQAILAELRQLGEKSERLAEIAYANLASSTWVGKQSLSAHYGSTAARCLSNMLVAMSPAEANAMFLRMGEHMATTGGDLRRAQAVICDLPGVDVTLMGYRDEREWRAGYDAQGNPIPGYVAPISKQTKVDYDDIFYEDE